MKAAIKTYFLKLVFLNNFKNPWKVNEEKFTFNSIETWKPTTKLDTTSFKKDLPRILIKFLVNSYIIYLSY